MKKTILAFIIFFFYSAKTFATWSIIMIDPKTNEIGIAGASCTYNCYGIGKIIPNMGAIIVQAMSNNKAREKGVEMILAESTPEQIIQALRDLDFDPERQQYAVITVKYIDRPCTYTGDSSNQFKGALTKTGVSVQGNTLVSDNVLRTIIQAVEKGQNETLVTKPDNKKPYINLNIFGQPKGGQNAVKMLRKKFEKWKRKHQL